MRSFFRFCFQFCFGGVASVLGALCVLLFCPQTADADVMYQLTDLGGLGGADSRAVGINSAGDVVGWAYTPDDEISHAYKYSAGSLRDLHPTGLISQANGINSGGTAVGMAVNAAHRAEATRWDQNGISYLDSSHSCRNSLANAINDAGFVTGDAQFFGPHVDSWHAFRSEGGSSSGGLIDIGTLGGSISSGLAINSAGNVVGWSLTGSTQWQQRAFFCPQNGVMHEIGTLGSEHSQANDLNDSNQIVGWSWRNDGRSEAFLYSNGNMRGLGRLETLGGFSSSANGINEDGTVVGWWSRNGYERLAFVFLNDQMIDLNSLIDPNTGWRLVEATAINDSGSIVGYGIDPYGIDRGFLLTPIPSPATPVGLLVPIMGTIIRRRR